MPEQLTADELRAKSVSGAASYFARTIFLTLINLATMVILTTKLQPAEFGVYGLVTQFIGVLVFLSDIGLAAALIQKKEEPTESELRTSFTVQQVLSWLVLAICGIAMTSGIISQKTGPVGNWILAALAISFPLAGLKTIPSVLLERKLEYSKLVVPQIIETLVFNAVLVYLVLTDAGVIAYAYAILLRSLSGVIAMFVIKPWRPTFGFDRSTWHLFRFGAAFQLNDLLARIKDQFYFLALGYLLPLNQFGYVQWSKNWSMYPYNLTVQNVMAITFPTFSRLQENPRLLARAIEKTIYFITLGVLPMLAGIALFVWPLIEVFPQYQKWQPALLSLALFCFSIAWGAISTPLTNVLNAIGKIKHTLQLMTMWTVLTWVATSMLLPIVGYEAVAWAAAAVALTSVLPVIIAKKYVRFQFWDQVWRQLVAVIVMIIFAVAGMDFWGASLLMLLTGMVSSALIYAVMTIALGPEKCYHEVRSVLIRRPRL